MNCKVETVDFDHEGKWASRYLSYYQSTEGTDKMITDNTLYLILFNK